MRHKITFKRLPLVAVAILFASCGGRIEIVYDVPFEQMVVGAQETGRDFCVVISHMDRPPCAEYVRALTDGQGGSADVAYNIAG